MNINVKIVVASNTYCMACACFQAHVPRLQLSMKEQTLKFKNILRQSVIFGKQCKIIELNDFPILLNWNQHSSRECLHLKLTHNVTLVGHVDDLQEESGRMAVSTHPHYWNNSREMGYLKG